MPMCAFSVCVMGGTEQSKYTAHGKTKEFAVAHLMIKTGARQYTLVPPEAPHVLFHESGREWVTNVVHVDEYTMRRKICVKRRSLHDDFVAFYRTLQDV